MTKSIELKAPIGPANWSYFSLSLPSSYYSLRNLAELQRLFVDHFQQGTTLRAFYLFKKNGFILRQVYSRIAYRTSWFRHFSSRKPNSLSRLSWTD